jgi:hypothetical protein
MIKNPKSSPVQHAILQMLTQNSGGAKDATAISEASIKVWSEVSTRLAPIIGSEGVEALFNRSLTIAARANPWLAHPLGSNDSATPMVRFRTNLEHRDPISALEVSGVVMGIFYSMLETLIGESLTERLLGPIFGNSDKNGPRSFPYEK